RGPLCSCQRPPATRILPPPALSILISAERMLAFAETSLGTSPAIVFSPLLYQLSYLATVLLLPHRRDKDFGSGRSVELNIRKADVSLRRTKLVQLPVACCQSSALPSELLGHCDPVTEPTSQALG